MDFLIWLMGVLRAGTAAVRREEERAEVRLQIVSVRGGDGCVAFELH